jgi:hypothetical protein
MELPAAQARLLRRLVPARFCRLAERDVVWCMSPQVAASVWGLELLVHGALSYECVGP